eukprot:1157084-Pelagomonas_calceolata.AAC.3
MGPTYLTSSSNLVVPTVTSAFFIKHEQFVTCSITVRWQLRCPLEAALEFKEHDVDVKDGSGREWLRNI